MLVITLGAVMEWFAFVILQGALAGAAGLVITLTLKEPISNRLAPIITMFGSKKEHTIQGKWVATFHFGPDRDPYVEVIEISSLLGMFVGRIVPDPLNYEVAAKASKDLPIRVHGVVKDNRFFTGQWLHPSRRNHAQGAFQLLILTGNDEIEMKGRWVGYSETSNRIEAEDWVWKRVEETKESKSQPPVVSQ